MVIRCVLGLVIRLVVFDADLTLWNHPDISSLKLPFKCVDEKTIVDANGTCINLFEGVKYVLQELRRKGLIVALVTWNKPEQVAEYAAASDITLNDEILERIEETLDNKPTTPFRQWG